MYEYIFKNIQPRDYEGWREASIQQQKVFVHMKSRLEQFNPRKNTQQGLTTGRATTTTTTIDGVDPTFQTSQIQMQWIYPQEEHLAQAEDYEPGRNRYQPPGGVGRENGMPVGQRKVLKCFNCDKPGHFKRDCRQPLRQNPYQQNQGPPCTRQVDTEEDGLYTARSIVDDCSVVEGRTPQQKAQAWLKGWPKNLMRLKTLLCNNCGGERIFKMPEPNGLGEGSSL
jgi:hypothetical protein